MFGIRRIVVAACFAAALAATGAGSNPTGAQSADAPAVTLRAIVATSPTAAERVLERARSGESFVTLATAESIAPTASEGGWLGRVPLAQLRPEVRRAIEGLRPGQMTGVIRIPTGFAIFKVEPDESADTGAPGAVGPELASAGAVRYLYDLGGFSDARTSLEVLPKAAGWNLDLQQICDARSASLAATRSSIEGFLAPENQAAAAVRDSLDIMELYIELGQLDAFEGRMDGVISRLGQAQQVAATPPAARLPLDEALGIAYFHKAGIDNELFQSPGDLCLLDFRSPRAYPKPAAAVRGGRLLRALPRRKSRTTSKSDGC